MLGTLALSKLLSAGQAEPRTQGQIGDLLEKVGRQKGKLGQGEEEGGTHLLVLGFPSLEQEEWGLERSGSGGGAE